MYLSILKLSGLQTARALCKIHLLSCLQLIFWRSAVPLKDVQLQPHLDAVYGDLKLSLETWQTTSYRLHVGDNDNSSATIWEKHLAILKNDSHWLSNLSNLITKCLHQHCVNILKETLDTEQITWLKTECCQYPDWVFIHLCYLFLAGCGGL